MKVSESSESTYAGCKLKCVIPWVKVFMYHTIYLFPELFREYDYLLVLEVDGNEIAVVAEEVSNEAREIAKIVHDRNLWTPPLLWSRRMKAYPVHALIPRQLLDWISERCQNLVDRFINLYGLGTELPHFFYYCILFLSRNSLEYLKTALHNTGELLTATGLGWYVHECKALCCMPFEVTCTPQEPSDETSRHSASSILEHARAKLLEAFSRVNRVVIIPQLSLSTRELEKAFGRIQGGGDRRKHSFFVDELIAGAAANLLNGLYKQLLEFGKPLALRALYVLVTEDRREDGLLFKKALEEKLSEIFKGVDLRPVVENELSDSTDVREEGRRAILVVGDADKRLLRGILRRDDMVIVIPSFVLVPRHENERGNRKEFRIHTSKFDIKSSSDYALLRVVFLEPGG